MYIETPTLNHELINTGFIDKIFSGRIKEAQEQSSLFIRAMLHEDGILRRLFENRVITADELDPELDNDQPSVICEKEPDAPQATFVSFKGTGPQKYFNGKRFRVPFGKIESDRENKSKFELMTIRMPITDWLKEHQVKAIQNEEDKAFFGAVNDIVEKNPANQSLSCPISTGDVNLLDVFTIGKNALRTLLLPIGKVAMHANTFDTWGAKLQHDVISNDDMKERLDRGTMGESSFFGTPIVTTIKSDIIPENVIYFFAPQEYFCKFFLLQDATLYLETKADMIAFHTYEAPGLGIGNTNGVVKVTLV